jgi:putative polysaccharide biosynthesis protein
MEEVRERRIVVIQKIGSLWTLARRAGRAAGRALFTARNEWRRRLWANECRRRISEKHRYWCSDFTAPATDLEQVRSFLTANFDGYSDTRWHEVCWRITGRVDPAFIPYDVFYLKIEPRLNLKDYQLVLTDKNAQYLNSMLTPHLPEPVLHLAAGDFYLPSFLRVGHEDLKGILDGTSEQFVVKPAIEHGGGLNLQIMNGEATIAFLRDFVARSQRRTHANWVVQRRLRQCDEMARFNASSVNTFRIMTMRLGQEVVYLSSVLRVGRAGMLVDNQMAGGLAAGIAGNRLRGRAMDRDFYFHERHPDSGVSFTGELPAYDEALALCQNLHQATPWFDLISWDVAIDERYRPKIIEFNVSDQELDFHQLNNGPLFGAVDGPILSALFRRLASRPPPTFVTTY